MSLKIFLCLPQCFAGWARDTPKSTILMVLSVTYGLILNLSVFHPDEMNQLKIKILIQDFVSEGDGKIEGGAFSLYLSFTTRCPNLPLLWFIMYSSSSTTHPSVSIFTAANCAEYRGPFLTLLQKGLLFSKLRILLIWQHFLFFLYPKIRCAICQC